MTELLDFAVDAHGGLDRARLVDEVVASITGAIWFVKGQGDALKDVVLIADTTAERLTVEFPGHRRWTAGGADDHSALSLPAPSLAGRMPSVATSN